MAEQQQFTTDQTMLRMVRNLKSTKEEAKAAAAKAAASAQTADSALSKATEALETAKTATTPTVNAEVSEEGVLTVNGKDTGARLITPKVVGEKVLSAFADVKMPSRVLDEQAKFENEQIKVEAKIAIERGKMYIEDALTPELRKKVYDGYYKTNTSKRDALEIVKLIQKWYDALPSNVFITTRGGFFPFTKHVGYKPEYFGADNRQINVGGMTLTVNGQQPCVVFHNSRFNVYDFALGYFCVEEMGLSAFHLCDNSEGNLILHGGNIITRAYKDFGYKSGLADPDKRWIPHIDGWTKEEPHIGTGMSLKGTAEAGFNTTTLQHDLARYMENSAVTANVRQPAGYNLATIRQHHLDESQRRYLSVGGYFNEAGESMFPQDDGTLAPTWGEWRGGQIWSRGYGWRIYHCRGTEIRNFDIRGFSGGAIVAGCYGSPSGEDINPGDVDLAIKKGLVAFNTRITGGYFTHNYICGIEAIRVSGYEACGIYCPDSVVGHPDASLEHVRGWKNSTVSLDPGYQQCTSRYLPMDNIYIHDNTFGLGKRKVMDIHTGNNVRIINNSGRSMYYGISTVIEEVFAARDGRASKEPDPYSFYFQDSNIEIVGNRILCGMQGLHPINGATGVLARRSKGLWWLRCRQLLADNTIYAPRGLVCNYGHNHFIIERNNFTFALPFGDFFGMRSISKVEVTNGGSGYTSPPTVIITGGGPEAFGAEAVAAVRDGRVVEVKMYRDGSRFSEPPTISFEGGGGSGAQATAYVNTQTFGMLVGAEAKYGTMLGTQIRNNWIQNSPEGNYARQIVFGKLRASSITGNHCDITPYSKPATAKKALGAPYVSEKVIYRDGLLSASYYGGEFDSCVISENFIHNQLTDVSTEWTGKYDKSDSNKNYRPTNYGEVLILEEIAKLKAATPPTHPAEEEEAKPPKAEPAAPEPSSPQPASPPAPEASPSPAPATPPTQPATSPETNSDPNSIKFTFASVADDATEAVASNGVAKLVSKINSVKAGEPEGWTTAFKTENGKRVMQALAPLPGKDGGVRFIEAIGLAADGSTPAALVFPFKTAKGGPTNSAFSVLLTKNGSVVNFGLLTTNSDAGFKLRAYEGITINGKNINPAQVYDYDKWYIAVLNITDTGKGFDAIRFGMNHAGNVGRTIALGEGVELVTGDSMNQLDSKVAALMQAYEVA